MTMSERQLNTQPSCNDDFDPTSLTCEAALSRILQQVVPLTQCERVHLRAALGRVLGAAVVSRIAVPGHRNSAMDGYAVRSADLPREGLRELAIVGSAFAGKPFSRALAAGEALRIMTGAVVPDGADTIVPQEHAEATVDTLTIDARHRAGNHVREAGEDIAIGATVLPAGTFVTPAELGLVASLGIGELTVLRRPRVAFFSTGDELRSLGETLAAGEIYDSNRYTLYGMLMRLGADISDLGVVPDSPDALAAAFTSAAAIADVVITSGGVSVGEADYTKDILDRLGEVKFWKVAMKPGRPLAFGRLGHALFFGLPGNPVSVMVTFYQFVLPALRRLMGSNAPPVLTVQARASTALKKRPGRVEFQRGRLGRDESGALVVTPTGDQGSGILSSMTSGDCFIVLPLESGRIEAGSVVEVQPFQGIV